MISCLAKGEAIKGTLFNIEVNFYFAKTIEDLDKNTFKDINNLIISIVVEPIIVLRSSTRTLYYKALENNNKDKGKLYKLIL